MTFWRPSRQQEKFLRLSCFEALYGGAAGGGKSDALLIDALSFVGRGYGSAYRAILFRRTYPELLSSLIIRAHEIFPSYGGVWRSSEHVYEFPQGEVVQFAHLQHEKDVHKYQGAAFQRIGFDELTTFTEAQYRYLFSRCRSAHGVPCGIRAATNPGNIGHKWVKKRFFPWVSDKSADKARPGEILYYLPVKDSDSETQVPKGTYGALGRTFIPAKLSDNRHLVEADPGYRSRLWQLPALERAQLEDGDWDKERAPKDFWDRSRIIVLPRLPDRHEIVARARGWDIAATPDGDYCAGVRMSRLRSGLIVVEHAFHKQVSADGLYSNFESISEADKRLDPESWQRIPQDPGAAGKILALDFQRTFPTTRIRVLPVNGSKITRFGPLSARALAGNVAVVADGSWDVDAYHAELEGFPAAPYDDLVDASSDAYAEVAGGAAPDFQDDSGLDFRGREDG